MKPVVVRGGGDLATGIIWQLCRAGYPVIILECHCPMAIRREAAFCEAVHFGEKTVEGITCRLVSSAEEAMKMVTPKNPVMLVDETGACLEVIKPDVVIDAILAKKNLGTRLDMAPLTIGVGPGFEAGVDVTYVVETVRGHKLARIIDKGSAMPNTGIPGIIKGYGAERVIHAPAAGILKDFNNIGDIVEKDQIIAEITDENGAVTPVPATLTGVLRGILPDGFTVFKGLKMADIDPRKEEQENCYTISDKARCIAGTVVTLVAGFEHGITG
ncbi:MAG: selenium-dependent molybdenum cofactor biosynthesis protein YqeB [Lachnospiraceae bacterium]|nr:selenium-dependent molybdenum cofactor biosynthesis protein YqeB [Lachnospiraceae bacterium]